MWHWGGIHWMWGKTKFTRIDGINMILRTTLVVNERMVGFENVHEVEKSKVVCGSML